MQKELCLFCYLCYNLSMKKYLKYEKWIRQMFDKYKMILFIEKHHLKMEKKDDGYLASEFNYPYLDVNIHYSEDSFKDWLKNKKDAERRMLHEFCHTITDPFYSVILDFPSKKAIENERERLTDHIAQIVNKHFNLI